MVLNCRIAYLLLPFLDPLRQMDLISSSGATHSLSKDPNILIKLGLYIAQNDVVRTINLDVYTTDDAFQ